MFSLLGTEHRGNMCPGVGTVLSFSPFTAPGSTLNMGILTVTFQEAKLELKLIHAQQMCSARNAASRTVQYT